MSAESKVAAPVDALAGALRVTCTDSPASGGVTTAIQAAVRELPAGTYWIVTDEARAAVAALIAADKEYDAAKVAYSEAATGRERNEMWTRVRVAESRRAAALAPFQTGGAE